MIDSLLQNWKQIDVVNSGITLDFNNSKSNNDFTFGAVFGLIHQLNKILQLGFGIGFLPVFGETLPLPFLYVDRKIIQKMGVNGILLSNILFPIKYNPKINPDLSLKIDNNRYFGNPDNFGDDNPLIKYSKGTINPAVHFHFTEWFHRGIEEGCESYHNFEFLDSNNSVQYIDLKQTAY